MDAGTIVWLLLLLAVVCSLWLDSPNRVQNVEQHRSYQSVSSSSPPLVSQNQSIPPGGLTRLSPHFTSPSSPCPPNGIPRPAAPALTRCPPHTDRRPPPESIYPTNNSPTQTLTNPISLLYTYRPQLVQPAVPSPIVQSDVRVIPAPPPPPDDLPLSSATLRERAKEEGDRMAESFSQSRNARNLGFRAEARKLATKAKEHQRVMEVLNQTASEMIFREKNKDREPHEIDLHGLYVKEAEVRVKAAILACEQRGDPIVRFIVGQGLHTADGVAKLKPALTYYIGQMPYPVQQDPRNAGVLVVSLNSAGDSATPRRQRNKRRARRG